MKVTVGRKRRGLAFLCVAVILITSVIFPVKSRASEQEDWEYMQWTSLKYGAETGTEDGYYVMSYDPGKNSPEYMLGISATGTLNNDKVYIVRIADSVFRDQTFAKIYVKTDSGMKIGANAFRGVCVKQITSNITDHSVKFSGGTVSEVGEYAFADMNVEGDFTLGNVVGDIKAHAFENTIIGGNLAIKGKVDAVGEHAFAGITIQGLSLPSIREIGDYAFARTNFERFRFSPSVERIGSRIFDECTKLKKIVLPQQGNIKEVALDAFPDSEGITIVIPENMENWGVYHLEQYSNVTFQLPQGLSEDNEIVQFMKDNHLKYVIGEPAETETPGASLTPMPSGTKTPDAASTAEPTVEPSAAPTTEPTVESSAEPTAKPTVEPSAEPTTKPTSEPTGEPSAEPTTKPTSEPMVEPSVEPTAKPTTEPTAEPSAEPTSEPTTEPTAEPSAEPTSEPTMEPDVEPTKNPGSVATGEPTGKPSSTQSPGGTQTSVPSGGGKTGKVFQSKKVRYRISGNNKVTVAGSVGKTAKKLTIPNIVKKDGRLYKVVAVEKKAFRGFKKLQKVTVGNYVRTIGDEAFSNCSRLKSITFGTGIVRIGKKALYKDRKLKNIVFRGKHLKKIGKKTFYGVPKAVKIVVPKAKIKQYRKLVRKSGK